MVLLARLINDHGVKLEKFSDKVYDGFAKAANEVFEETRASSDLAERVHSSFLKAKKTLVLGRTCLTHLTFLKETEH